MNRFKFQSLLLLVFIPILLHLGQGRAFAEFSFSVATEGADFTLSGTLRGEQFGTTMVSSDLNGDGRDELVVGSPFYTLGRGTPNGKVTIFISGRTTPVLTHGRTIEIIGKSGTALGTSLASGDFNGDGLSDLVMGAPQEEGGAVHIFFGRRYLRPFRAGIQEVSHAVFPSPFPQGNFGFAVLTLDMNRDHKSDLVISAPEVNHSDAPHAGRIFVFLGRERWGPRMAPEQPNLVIFNTKAEERFGGSLASTDVNGDGMADLIVATPQAKVGDATFAGRFDVFFGGRMSPYNLLVRQSFEADLSIVGDRASHRLGVRFASGDFDGDGVPELAVSSGKGGVFILRHAALRKAPRGIAVSDLSPTTIAAGDEVQFFGTALLSFDVNRDGEKDLFIGAPVRTKKKGPGEVVIMLGGMPEERWRFSGIGEGSWFGSEIIEGDFNGDGYSDIVVSAPVAQEKSQPTVGAVYGVFGGASWETIIEKKRTADTEVSRGLFLARTTTALRLPERHKSTIQSCETNPKLCFFVFSLESRFSRIAFNPFQLYPDVTSSHPFSSAINIATMLGLVRGVRDLPESPFRPDEPILRIHALKVLLEAARLIEWKERSTAGAQAFIPFSDVDPNDPARWWYARYLALAFKNGIIDSGKIFRPEETLRRFELEEWLQRASALLQQEEEAQALEA